MKLSVAEKLLRAAARLESAQGRQPFSAEDLVVAAWEEFPDTFGLSGHLDENGRPQFPDSNRVFMEIMGSKPIRKRGYLRKVGRKMYALTAVGRDAAARLDDRSRRRDVSTNQRTRLARENVAQIQRLLRARATKKVEQGLEEELTFHDACLFWGITPRSVAIDYQGRRAALQEIVGQARIEVGEGTRFTHSGREFSPQMLDVIIRTDAILESRFKDEIATILQRDDQRRQ